MGKIAIIGKDYKIEHEKAVDSILDKFGKVKSNKVKDVPGFKYIKTVQFKDLDTWDIKQMIGKGSPATKALAEKIVRLIFGVGSPSSVEPFLRSVVSGKMKVYKLCERKGKIGWHRDKSRERRKKFDTVDKHDQGVNEDVVIGHFRSGHTGFILTDAERKYIKKFFNL